MAHPRILSTNKLANHPAYNAIISQYNRELKAKGKVNDSEFFRRIIAPQIPDYSLHSWYQFLRKFKNEIGVMKSAGITSIVKANVPVVKSESEEELALTLLSNNEAIQNSIAAALNISAQALKDILQNPELVPVEKRAELFLKVMKAQDSRVKAIGTIRADNRDQERFDRAMDSAAF